MYLYLNHEEQRLVYALLNEKALWLCNKRIEFLNDDREETPEYANATKCAGVIESLIKQIERLSKYE